MSYIYLVEQGAGSWEECSSDTPQFVQWKLKSTQDECCCNDSETESCQSSPSGTTSVPSTETRGKEKSMSCAEGFHVRTSAQQVKSGSQSREILPEKEAASGKRWHELSERYNLDTSSWKTAQCLLSEGLPWFSVILPKWGTMQGGVCWEDTTQAGIAKANDSGLWPRPCKSEGTGGMAQTGSVVQMRKLVDNGQMEYEEALKITRGQVHKKNLPTWRTEEHQGYLEENGKRYSGESFGTLHPSLYEWVMMWPIGWTGLRPLGTDKIQEWLHSHGKS
jgi:hypothetical protein